MGLLNFLEKLNEDDKKKKQEELEKEMDALDLEEWEKDEIRQGNYDVTSFEYDNEEDFEDDDYYED